MSGDILQTPDAPKPQGALDNYFKITARGSTVRQEVLAGLTTFLAMVYSVIVVPGMLGKAGFPPAAVFVATCLVAGFGSLLMGLWANLPMAIGCAISLTAFTAFSLVLGQQISVPVALGAVFLMGVIFTAISVTGVRTWILRNLPMGIAHGTGIGIGLFLLLIAANGVGMVIKNPIEGLPVALGAFTSFPVMMSLLGLAVIFVLVLSNMLISLVRDIIPKKVRIVCFIAISASLVVAVELLMQAYAYPLYQQLGIFVPLIVVNCIILGRAEAFAAKNTVPLAIADGLGMGLGFTMSLTFLGSIREVFGAGTLFGTPVMWEGFRPFSVMVEAPGAFLCLGLILAAMNLINRWQAKRKGREEPENISSGCASCGGCSGGKS